MRYGILGTSLRALVPVAFFLASLTASADGPAPPAGGTPSASRLQEAHETGRTVGENTARAERVYAPFGGLSPGHQFRREAPDDLLRSKLDEYVKEHGSQWSEAEKEVFSEAYWKGAEKEKDRGGMHQIDPPSLQPPGNPTTTIVTGKTATPGPGTLQLTDEKGNSYFVDVDANGNYSTTVPQGNFQPTKMTLRTGTIKAAWVLNSDGKTWRQVSGVVGSSGTQGAMAPGRGSAQSAGQQVALLDDECKQYAVVGSLDSNSRLRLAQPTRPSLSPLLLPVRFTGGLDLAHPNPAHPFARLVGEGPPPTPTESGHRLADLERYKQQGKDAYGNDLPQDPAQREQKVNEREAKIQTERGKLFNPDGSKSQPPPIWTADDQKQMHQAYLERQRYYLDQDLKAAQDKADKKKANRALLENENEFLRNKFPVRMAAPVSTPAPSGTTGAMAPGTSGFQFAGSYTIQGNVNPWKGGAKGGTGVAIPTGSYRMVAGARHMVDETVEDWESDHKAGLWPPGSEEATPVGFIADDWAFNLGIKHDYLSGFALGKDTYKLAAQVNYNYAEKDISLSSAYTRDVDLTMNVDCNRITRLLDDANPWRIGEEAKAKGYNVATWSFHSSQIGNLLAWQVGDQELTRFLGDFRNQIVGVENNSGAEDAPVPGFTPDSWPRTPADAIPRFRLAVLRKE